VPVDNKNPAAGPGRLTNRRPHRCPEPLPLLIPPLLTPRVGARIKGRKGARKAHSGDAPSSCTFRRRGEGSALEVPNQTDAAPTPAPIFPGGPSHLPRPSLTIPQKSPGGTSAQTVSTVTDSADQPVSTPRPFFGCSPWRYAHQSPPRNVCKFRILRKHPPNRRRCQ